MTLTNEKEVKKWLRNLAIVKAELGLKIKFYQELESDFKDSDGLKRYGEEYEKKICELKDRLDGYIRDTDRLFSLLDENEKMIMIARYIKLIRWDYIQFQVFYSRRQAIRIHDNALKKLVGHTVGE